MEAKYRAALNALRLQKGTLSAVMAYYDEWEETLDQLAPVPGPRAEPPDRAGLLRAIEDLRSKADGFSSR